MLIDFADILHTNVTTLGHTFLNFCALLNLSVPTIDPSLYIERFASKLQFGDKLQNVANTALRLVQRMKRDWIITGRRPSGICGAALIIAARIHGFKRTVGEVVNIVRICDVTLRKRLGEFDRTASSNLTPEEFEVVELEQEMDPPCYTEGLQKAAKRKRKEERRKQKQGQREEREKQKQKENDKAKEKEVEDSDNVQTSNKADEIVVTKELQEEMELMLNTNEFKNMEADDTQQDVAETERSPSITTTNSNSDSVNSRKARKRRNRSDDEGEEEERDSVDKVISKLTMSDAFNIASSLEESAGGESVASSSQTESISCSSSSTSSSTTSTSTQTHSATNGGDTVWKEGQPFYWELLEEDTGNLSELDDNELEGYIVKSEEEVAIKKQIWEELNVEYLKELEEKQKQDAIKFPNGKPERPPRKKRATGPTRQRPAKTAAAAAASVLERRTSSKINYEALKGLMSPSSFASARK
ncbi:transcription factor TFIIIB subunit brf1 [Balamuthia mandrillaris]